MRSMLRSILAVSFMASFVACSAAPADEGSDDSASGAAPIASSDVIARAEQWVQAQLHYCQAANHQPDYDSACASVCNRTNNPAWDPYRSDCSGLVSWAWGLPAPGRTTYGFAPYDGGVSHVINASDLQAGDAVNNTGHVMLFKNWVTPGSVAVFIEEPGCSSKTPYAHELTSNVSISGSSIH